MDASFVAINACKDEPLHDRLEESVTSHDCRFLCGEAARFQILILTIGRIVGSRGFRFGAHRDCFRLEARGALRKDHRVRGGQIGGEQFRGGHDNDGITSIAISKLNASSDRCRPPRLLWVPPVNLGQEVTELRRRERLHTLSRARPDEATQAPWPSCQITFKSVAATTAEAKQVAAQRVAMQIFWTRNASDGKPFRTSAQPVASHTSAPAGNGIIVAVHRSAPPRLHSASPRQPRP
jgi:hypothetical protein